MTTASGHLAPHQPNESFSFKELVIISRKWYYYLRSKAGIIILFAALGGVLGFTYATLKRPIFTAKSTFVLEEGDKMGGIGGLGGLASIVGVDLDAGGGLFRGDNILELYKSRYMIQKTLLSSVEVNGQKQLLIDRYIGAYGLRESWAKRDDLKHVSFNLKPSAHFSRLQDSVIGTIVESIRKNNLVVGKPDKALSIIQVEVKSTDEWFSKSFNDQIVNNVNDFYVQTKTKKSLENVFILQHQTDSVRNVLYGAIYQSATINDATPNLNPTRQVLRAPAQRSQLSAEANKVILAELVKNLELAKLSLRRETPLIQVIDVPVLPLPIAKMGKFLALFAGSMIMVVLSVTALIVLKSIKDLLR